MKTVRRNCARLKSTVPIGKMALGNATLFSSPALSTIDPVDMVAELALNVHAN